jgi:hypothetical protein
VTDRPRRFQDADDVPQPESLGTRITVWTCAEHGALDEKSLVPSVRNCPVLTEVGICGRDLSGPHVAMIHVQAEPIDPP